MTDLMLSKKEKIITTSNSLKRKFNERDAEEAENKRSQKHQRQNKSKNVQLRNDCHRDGAVKLAKIIAPEHEGQISKESLVSEELKISSTELEKFDTTCLKPRFHLEPLEYLINSDVFENEEHAVEIKNDLYRKANDIEVSNQEKEKKYERSTGKI